MQKNHFELIAPLLGGSKMLGFLVLGQKNHNRSYTLTDIHLISATASQLAIALENARNYDEVLKSLKFKDEFITIASAHLRTPVTAILGYLRYLTDNKNKLAVSEQQTIIGHVRANSERLASLIDELLTISALEHGKVKTIPRDTQIEEVIEEVVDSLSYFASEHRVTISYMRPKQSFPKIYLDPIKIREAISNIISNGIRFNNPGGQVTIELSKNDKNAVIVISDNGIGIKKEDIPYLFQKFHRISSQRGGVGLGLYITKLIIKAHSGDLNLQSEVNKGTVVTITLPIKGHVVSQIIIEPG
jgi:two-component system sensor histidine kinase VicK